MADLPRVAVLLLLAVLTVVAGAEARPERAQGPLVQVLVALDDPALANAQPARSLSGRGDSTRRLRLTAPASVRHLRTLAVAQRSIEADLERAVPDATVRRRYQVVANALAVVLPASEVDRLRALPGVSRIYPSVRYRPLLDRSVQQIGAPALWGPGLAGSTGVGLKIGIIDDGIDQSHPFFAPAGYAMPAGFPKGQTAFTTAKVIVARAFPPAGPKWKHASKPFDPEHSGHATHVAGIAAGNANTQADGDGGRARVSGVAPRAYLGNYKALTIPTDAEVGLDGNSPELVAAIEAAVKDGMDVINLSLGEPEIEPSRDIVALALDAAARAGVVPVVAAGNDFDELGRGSVGSPGSSARAITVGAVSTARAGTPNTVASFSASGPAPLSLRQKPDVAAPGVAILSSTPRGWDLLSGTSMAAPHVAGAAALLRERHRAWTVEQLKSALVQTGADVADDAGVARQGGGIVNLPRADAPLVFASPSGLSFGLMRRGTAATRTVALADAGGGAGEWSVAFDADAPLSGVALSASAPTVAVPGTLSMTVTPAAGSAAGELAGHIVLTRGADVRRIPFWLRVTAPVLAAPSRTLTTGGVYRGNTRGRPARVSVYRYPERPTGFGFASTLNGPEQVFRVRLQRNAANLGVAITSRARGVRVEPRIVAAGDENRLAGVAALPFNLNPYLRGFGDLVPAAGVLSPRAGLYDIVFDSGTPAGAGAFTFRFWIGDTGGPTVAFGPRSVRRGSALVVRVRDSASGADPASLRVSIDSDELERPPRLRDGVVRIPTAGLRPGRHALRLQVSDYQETRNMENVGRILPNTRIVRTTFTVR